MNIVSYPTGESKKLTVMFKDGTTQTVTIPDDGTVVMLKNRDISDIEKVSNKEYK